MATKFNNHKSDIFLLLLAVTSIAFGLYIGGPIISILTAILWLITYTLAKIRHHHK